MPRHREIVGERLNVEIHKLDIVKERCTRNRETVKAYINRLIHEDMKRADEDISIRYFKEEYRFWKK